MATVLEAPELIERFLAEVGREDFKKQVDLSNPVDVALIGACGLLQHALKIRQNGVEGGAAQAVVDTPWHPDVRKRYPTHEADSLMILAWAATCHVVDRGDGRHEPLPFNLVWANRTLRTILEYRGAADKSSLPPGWYLNHGLESFLTRLGDGPGEEPAEASEDLKASKEILLTFWHAITKAPLTVIRCSIEDLQAEASRGTITFTPEGEEKGSPDQLDRPERTSNQDAVEIFRQSFFLRDKFHVVVGARALHPAGLRLRLVSDENAPFAKYYDLYAVWNLQLPSQGPISPEAFLSVQGLFIPVDIRRRLYESVSEMHQRHQTAALVARNLSHNLGSHALLYVARELQQKTYEDRPEGIRSIMGSDVADFLHYLVNRADLVAMLASGPGHPFSVVLPLETAIEQFNKQELLQTYLCASERLKVSKTLLLGDAGTVDLPGGLVGGQALCAILENFARNSAKHSKRKEPSSLGVELVFEVERYGNGLLRCRLSDKAAAPISVEDFNALQNKVAATSSIPTGPWGRASTDLNVGFGLEEIATWLAYLRRKTNRREWSCDPPLMEYERDELGRLYLVFYLLQSVRIRRLEVSDLGKRENFLPAQLTLVRSSELRDFKAHVKLPGRWLSVFKENGRMHFKSRFAGIDEPEHRWREIGQEPTENPNLALAAYVETLRQFALLRETLNVVVIDAPWYAAVCASTGLNRKSGVGRIKELVSPHPQIRFFAADEHRTIALPDALGKSLHSGALAIWHRHGTWLNTLSDSSICQRVIHYEVYSGPWNADYCPIFSGQLSKSPDDLLFLYGQLAEAALLRGYIIDERFARIYADDVELCNRLRWMGIQVIDPFSRQQASLAHLLREIGTHQSRPSHWPGGHLRNSFVSIHASLKRSQELMGGRKWKSLLDDFGAPIPFLALHSGRGGIEEVRDLDYPFFPASLFQSWAFDKPCKLFLSEALMRGGWI